MKRKQMVAVGILSICLLTCGCGSNTTITGQNTEDKSLIPGLKNEDSLDSFWEGAISDSKLGTIPGIY